MGHFVWQLFPCLRCCGVGTSLRHHIPVTLRLLGLCCSLSPLWRGHFPLLAVERVCLCRGSRDCDAEEPAWMLSDKWDAHLELLLRDPTPLAPAAGPCLISASFAESQGKEAAAEQELAALEVGMETPSPVHAAGKDPQSFAQNIPCPRGMWESRSRSGPAAVTLHHGDSHTVHRPVSRAAAIQPLPLS